jgi:glycine/D-amino acid oxidase-like deaminating enzyme
LLDAGRLLRRVAGIRPFRRGAIRIELERIGAKTVVHNYGHSGAGVTLSWGSAEEAADLVQTAAQPPTPIAVLGSGAVGLSTARVLQERGFPVHVLARDFPPRTTSNLAGAEWMPVGVATGRNPEERDRFRRILRRSWERFEALLADPSWGVFRRSVYESSNSWVSLAGVPKELLPPQRLLERLPLPGSTLPGSVRETFLIEPPIYMPRLLGELIERGGALSSRTFRTPSDLEALAEPVLVDCLGLGAAEVFGDKDVVPIRGQLVHLFPECLPYLLTHRGGYMFPRHDALVLGGTWEEGVADPTPSVADCDAILERHRSFLT